MTNDQEDNFRRDYAIAEQITVKKYQNFQLRGNKRLKTIVEKGLTIVHQGGKLRDFLIMIIIMLWQDLRSTAIYGAKIRLFSGIATTISAVA